MTNDELLQNLDEYCLKTGLAASTVCVRALGDSRFVGRHQRRLTQIDKDGDRLRAYMAQNPPPETPSEDAA